MANIFDDNSEFKKYLKPEKGANFESEDTELHIDSEEVTAPQSSKKNKIKVEKQVSSYTLDLSGKAVSPSPFDDAPAKAKATKPAAKKTKAKAKATKPKNPRSKTTEFVIENLRTFLYGVIIFMIGYLALNYSAYYEVAQNTYYELTDQEANPVLRTFTDNTPVENVITTEASDDIISSVPNFDMEITPPGTRIIIPRLDKNVPVVAVPENNLVRRDWEALEGDLQGALRSGVVHYPGTPWPGQSGNVVMTGHSSYYPWDPGRFKDVFAVLHNVKEGDEVIVFHNQRKYRYKVEATEVVLPQQVEVLGDTGDDRLTLLTCTPIGTNLKRLIVTAKPIDA